MCVSYCKTREEDSRCLLPSISRSLGAKSCVFLWQAFRTARLDSALWRGSGEGGHRAAERHRRHTRRGEGVERAVLDLAREQIREENTNTESTL